MMVTFVSQCEKKALNRTRRVLDAFADRIGDNTWQTVITQEGLLAVKKLLRKTATKNTAVSCHWIRSRARSELVWVVGNRSRFDHEGRVPVNTTLSGRPNTEYENRWRYASAIQIVAVLAALLHDIGKSTVGFQRKLKAPGSVADPFRHEWISLRLFQAMIHGCKTDREWLERLASFDEYIKANPAWMKALIQDSKQKPKAAKVDEMPALAQLLAWLVVTHHRLPTFGSEYYKTGVREELQKKTRLWRADSETAPISLFYQRLKAFPRWVNNTNVEESADYWLLQAEVMASKSWQKKLKRWATKASQDSQLMALAEQPISDPLLMNMARLCLMLGDHNYSRLEDPTSKKWVRGDADLADKLAANTDKQRNIKQALDAHLLGVAGYTATVAREIPKFSSHLRELHGLPEKHRPFLQKAQQSPYLWQNGAFNLARKIEPQCREQGFFGVNMASTGRGKTLANARIMYALAAPGSGARFTIALGLRVLTLQTGKALRERLALSEDDLAVLVGGAANRKLFELAQQDEQEQEHWGSESAEALLDDGEEVIGSFPPDEFGTLLEDKKTRQLLAAPVVTCTVDHIMQASECSRGGRYIAPVLRLLTSDLVFDEPDDFDQNDLPALARLVHLAGLYGSKVLLSSATLTPDMVSGLYQAYAAGRRIWNNHMGWNPSKPVMCGWFDEYNQASHLCGDGGQFQSHHANFVAKRVEALAKSPPRRKAEILPCKLPPARENQKLDYLALAEIVAKAALQLHNAHAQTCPTTGKTASVGLLRMANVSPLITLVQALYQQQILPDDVQLHLCCYHAKQLLVLRDAVEQKLDRILHRGEPDPFITQPEVQQALASCNAKHHIFLVAASPVAEVGRDHDYDWTIVEPSSMRSLIQLAGRVGRHRPERVAQVPNLLVLEKNIRGVIGENIAFQHPGFEQRGQFQLSTHNASELIADNELANVDSQPRIDRPVELLPHKRLAHLEHAVMQSLLNDPGNYVAAWWQPGNANHASAHLQKISPFRHSEGGEEDYVCLPVGADTNRWKFAVAESAWNDLDEVTYQTTISMATFEVDNAKVTPWLQSDLEAELPRLAQQLGEEDLRRVARQYAVVRLRLGTSGGGWKFHPWFGFWKNS